jgi:hypothetical protein
MLTEKERKEWKEVGFQKAEQDVIGIGMWAEDIVENDGLTHDKTEVAECVMEGYLEGMKWEIE